MQKSWGKLGSHTPLSIHRDLDGADWAFGAQSREFIPLYPYCFTFEARQGLLLRKGRRRGRQGGENARVHTWEMESRGVIAATLDSSRWWRCIGVGGRGVDARGFQMCWYMEPTSAERLGVGRRQSVAAPPPAPAITPPAPNLPSLSSTFLYPSPRPSTLLPCFFFSSFFLREIFILRIANFERGNIFCPINRSILVRTNRDNRNELVGGHYPFY